MRRYIEKLHTRPVHEKREFAVHAAAAVTGLVVVVWLSTLGMRFATQGAETTLADADASNLIAGVATAGAALQEQMRSMGNMNEGADTNEMSGYAETEVSPATVIGIPNQPATTLDQ